MRGSRLGRSAIVRVRPSWWFGAARCAMATAAVYSVWPLRGDHQGATSITIHGTGFGGYDAASLRC